MRHFILCILAAGCSSPTMTTNDAATEGGGDNDAGMEASMEGEAGGNMCSAVVQQFLDPKDAVSQADVTILSDMAGVKTLYIDASAGGLQPTEPRVYVDLATAMRVDITDPQAPMSTKWDIAFKRYVIFTNDGDTGPGMGGALLVAKAFDQVTAADAMGKTLGTEKLVDKDCNPIMDMLGGPTTTFSGWYNYDMQTMAVTPKPNTTYIVRAANGTTLYKLAIDSYYGLPDGGTGMASAHYLVKLAAL